MNFVTKFAIAFNLFFSGAFFVFAFVMICLDYVPYAIVDIFFSLFLGTLGIVLLNKGRK